MPAPSTDQRAGCLLGLALGDALGFVVEAQPAAVAVAYVRDDLGAGRAGSRSHPAFPFGQYSDDTQLARELLLSIRDQGRFDPAAFGSRIAALFTSGLDVGAGRGSRTAALRIATGVPWTEAGEPAPYAGNGSTMRAAPLGLIYDQPELIRVAVEQSRVTHQDVRCAAGATALAGAAALAARGGDVDPAAWLNQLASWVGQVHGPMADALSLVADWVSLDPSAAACRLAAERLDPVHSDVALGVSSHVLPSTLWALYAFLRNPDSYWDTISTAIAVGGDTDTLAAMAGALAGARLGAAALPTELVRRVNDRGRWGAAELADLAQVAAKV